MLFDILDSGLRQGLLLIPLAVGVHVAFRLARYPDLTADGSMIVGSSVAVLILFAGYAPVIALVGGALAGGLLGMMTAIVSEYLGVDRILAGIGTSLFAYSLSLRFLGRGNVPLPLEMNTIYSGSTPEAIVSGAVCIFALVIVCLITASRLGLRLRAVGENEKLAGILGARTRLRLILGLFWANVCVGLSGALLVEHQRFTDVGQGAGSLFIGLACILLGTAMPGHSRLLAGILWSAMGAIVYASIIAGALRLGLQPGDLRAVTAILVIATTMLAKKIAPGERLPLF